MCEYFSLKWILHLTKQKLCPQKKYFKYKIYFEINALIVQGILRRTKLTLIKKVFYILRLSEIKFTQSFIQKITHLAVA